MSFMPMGNQLSSRSFIIISAGGHVARGFPNEVSPSCNLVRIAVNEPDGGTPPEIAAHYNPD